MDLIGRVLSRNDALLKHGLVVFAAGLAGNILNYLYQLLMGRMLGPEQYGILGALISLTYLLTVPAQTIQTSTAKLVSKLQATGRSEDVGYAIRHLGTRVALGSLVSAGLILVLSVPIAHLLRIPSAVPVAVLGAAFFFQLLVPALNGSLVGLQRFGRFGAAQVANFSAKLALGGALVALGLGVSGAVAGLVLGAAVGAGLGMFFLRDTVRVAPVNTELPKMISYAGYTLLAFLCLTLVYNMDVILVRWFFTDVEAGYYAAAATLARAVFFGSIAIAGALFPKVAAWGERGDSAVTSRLLRDALVYTGLLAGFGAIVLNLFPTLVVSLLFGSTYSESARVVGPLSLAMLFLSLSYVLVSYQLALGARRFVGVLVTGFVVQAAGIAIFHGTLQHVALVMIAAMLLVLAGTAALALIEQHRLTREEAAR